MKEVIEFFRHTIQSANEEEEKLDEHLQPIPPELHGAVTRTSPELLRHYEHLGIFTFQSMALSLDKVIHLKEFTISFLCCLIQRWNKLVKDVWLLSYLLVDKEHV